jgi:hypothetical protein
VRGPVAGVRAVKVVCCVARQSLRESKGRTNIRPFKFAVIAPGFIQREVAVPHSTRLLSFTFSASRYTCPPISLNFCDIAAMPSSMVPAIAIPTPVGSFSVAA